jgi:predicted DNA-binding transcriptional regulator AlpA
MRRSLLDINELSAELKIATKTIRNRLSNKSWPIPPIRIGRTLRWRPSDVTRALASLTDKNGAQRSPRCKKPIN